MRVPGERDHHKEIQ